MHQNISPHLSAKIMTSNTDASESQVLSSSQTTTGPTTLSFHHISYSVKTHAFPWSCSNRLKVLSDLSGYMPPGMNAVIGPTGCGKSTLLDVLAGRKNPSKINGYLLLNGQFLQHNVRRRLCGYVVQVGIYQELTSVDETLRTWERYLVLVGDPSAVRTHDPSRNENIAMDTLTVRENITFSATLRLPRCTTSRERDAKVSSVIEELGLTSAADRILGTQLTRGISAGERKRTCIGIELVNDPLVLYLDEPTTGLDAYTAGTVIQTLRRLADSGRTVVFSIHQPKYSIYRLFDRLTILSDGQMIYHGPAGKTPIAYFESCGYLIEGHNNPADFFMDILHGEVDVTEAVPQQTNTSTIPDTNENVGTCKTLREMVRRKLISYWLESTLCQQCKVFLEECSRDFHMNVLKQSKQPKLKKLQRQTSNISTFSWFTHQKTVKASQRNKVYDTDFIQPGNYLSTLDREIEKFDELWALSRSVSTITAAAAATIRDDELNPVTGVKHEIDEVKLIKTIPELSEFQLNKSYRVRTNDKNKIISRHKIINRCRYPQVSVYQQCQTSFCHQLWTLNWRSYLNLKRSSRTILAHFIIQLVIALFLGIIYLNMDKWRESGIQNRMGLFFFTCVHLLFISGALLEIFLKDRVNFMHETSAGFYRISTYFLSRIISDVLPTKAIPAFLCLSITYFLSGLRYELRPFLFWQLTITLLTICASAITFAVSAMVTDNRIGSMLLSMFFVLMMITSGYLVNISTLWKWLQLVRYISILRYAINILAINELLDMKFCPRSILSSSPNLNSVNISDPVYSNLTATILEEWKTAEHFQTGIGKIPNLESLCITGVQYLQSQAVEYQSSWAVWLNELGIFVITIVALGVAYFHLRLIKRYK